MNKDFTFTIKSTLFDENYNPSESTRITTNFANLARGKNRQENLRNTLIMIDNRFNTLTRSFINNCGLQYLNRRKGGSSLFNNHFHGNNIQRNRVAIAFGIIPVRQRIEPIVYHD